jgi:hypothetical protein
VWSLSDFTGARNVAAGNAADGIYRKHSARYDGRARLL